MAIEDLIAAGPKALRPALWVIAFGIIAGVMGIAGMSAIEAKAALAATETTAPVIERVSKLEAGQQQMWSTIGSKLDTISTQLTQTRQDVAVLSQKVQDHK